MIPIAKHPDYARLAARMVVSDLHKMTVKSFSETMQKLYEYTDPKSGNKAPLISEELHQVW